LIKLQTITLVLVWTQDCYYCCCDGKCGLGGWTQNGVQATDCWDTRPPRGGLTYVLGCSRAPSIIFGTCPFHRGTFSVFFCSVLGIPIAIRHECVHQWRSLNYTQWDVLGTPKCGRAHPNFNISTRPRIFGVIWQQVQRQYPGAMYCYFRLKKQWCFTMYLLLKTWLFHIMFYYFSNGQWAAMYKYSTSNEMCL